MPATAFLLVPSVPFTTSPAPAATCFSFQEPKTASDAPTSGAAPAPQTGGTTAPGGTAPQQGQPAPAQGPDLLFYVMLPALLLFLWWTSRSQNKARKEQQSMLASIKKGDRIVTSGGIHGIVDRLDDRTLVVLLDTVPVTFERSAIARVVRDDAARTEPKRA
jgi:preprotein translocase subunit YajC